MSVLSTIFNLSELISDITADYLFNELSISLKGFQYLKLGGTTSVAVEPYKVTLLTKGELIYFDLLKVKICYIEFLLLQDQLSVGYDYFSLHFRIVNFDLLNTKKI